MDVSRPKIIILFLCMQLNVNSDLLASITKTSSLEKIASLCINLTCGDDKSTPINIKKISSISQAQSLLEQSTPQTLVLFDVDNTLIAPRDYLPRMYASFSTEQKNKIIEHFPELQLRETRRIFESMLWGHACYEKLEDNSVELIESLVAKKVSVLGLTSLPTGAYGNIVNCAHWRNECLSNLGFAFTKIYSDTKLHSADLFAHKQPELLNGVLYTDYCDKGLVLGRFLDEYKLKFDHIIFFDDDLGRLNEVASVCEKRKIKCTLFHYQCEKYTNNSAKMEMKKITYQIEHLLEKQSWISDEELISDVSFQA